MARDLVDPPVAPTHPHLWAGAVVTISLVTWACAVVSDIWISLSFWYGSPALQGVELRLTILCIRFADGRGRACARRQPDGLDLMLCGHYTSAISHSENNSPFTQGRVGGLILGSHSLVTKLNAFSAGTRQQTRMRGKLGLGPILAQDLVDPPVALVHGRWTAGSGAVSGGARWGRW